ncbi:hypothetical protein [Microbacterium sp.]|uniref:hypothetical protein n=1 Tax=Microbacterium sp. TaxID=51671 RepID=UPI003C77D4FD
MMTSRSHIRPRVAAMAFVAVLTVPFALAGCASTPTPTHTPTPTPTPNTKTQTAPAPAPSSETPQPQPEPTAATFTCDELVPVSLLNSTFGGSFTAQTPPAATDGSAVAQIIAAGGTACAWSNDSGQQVALAAGQFEADVIQAGESAAARAGEQTDAFGSDLTAYASGQGGTTIDVFSEIGAWVHTESVLFTSPAVAGPIVTSVMQELPS